ncbi:NAD(+)--rifampin ADP-ribosyltransferase [Demequina muriae]|uniref:NAD(+)--rifampin ADP-ribosyltransferase n=1 Tax=Demequina muriae TaxID=3051664 RepID=A0ABT8GE66_9MICO|nr:NAD(+)--rifampin ADP-ribosyltransferase [Demequina sp. EGI L300058]MDN4479723.1 NAD(+)--rifampin ADP-ribosyltransferase [Demequina sp. EGI L300058]
MTTEEVPQPFEVYGDGETYLHGTKVLRRTGDVLTPGYASNYRSDRVANHLYITKTLDAATWGAELASGEGRGHIYVVEPVGAVEDDPNVTDKRFPGNPTMSYRTREPVRVVGELLDWVGHPVEQVQHMRDSLADLERRGEAIIDD